MTVETLSKEEVEEIRRLGREKLYTPSQLAAKYDVDVGHIRYILGRKDKHDSISKTS